MALDLVVDKPAAAVPAVQQQAGELTVGELKKRLAIITEAMQQVMKSGTDYGKIPGTNKPTLMKPGAEKLCVLFQFGGKPSRITKTQDGNHLTVDVEYELFHIPTGRPIGTGVGSASTKESKYAYRKANRVCPRCRSEAVFKSKNEPGYYCWAKKGGCGAKFQSPEDITSIESQQTGRKENEDLPDQYNTILKMAKKRAKIDATLDATGASAIFTQDAEDFRREHVERDETPPPDDEEAPQQPLIREPSEKATAEDKAALIAAADEIFDGKGKDWCNKALGQRGVKKWGEVTVGDIHALMKQMDDEDPVHTFITEGRIDENGNPLPEF
jgi:hypothetical protein